MGAFVYMLRCADDSFYVGIASGDDLTLRIAQHQAGTYHGYTFTRRPVHLVWSEHFPRITDAIAVERQLKGWSRAKKAALVQGDWSAIERLSKRRGGRPRPARKEATANRQGIRSVILRCPRVPPSVTQLAHMRAGLEG